MRSHYCVTSRHRSGGLSKLVNPHEPFTNTVPTGENAAHQPSLARVIRNASYGWPDRGALADGSSKWITSSAARADVQRLRARASAVLTGIGTVLADDPALTVRDARVEMHGRVPLRVVFDARGQLPPRARIANDEHATLLLTSKAGGAQLQAHGIRSQLQFELELLPVDAHGRLDPAVALQRLAERDCNEVLVEAGARLAGSFVAAGLADEIVVYLAPAVLGDTGRPSFVLPQPLRSLEHRSRFTYADVRMVGPDLRVTLRPVEDRR